MTSRLSGEVLQVGGLRIHHTTGGRGRPLLMIHGLGSSGYMEWRRNLAHLARSHRVLAPDLPGFGRSDKPASARYGIAYFARVLRRYLDTVGVRSAAVVGTSLGGRVAIELALTAAPRVQRLVLVNALGLGRPRLQVAYPLLALPRVGEAAMRVAGLALSRAPDSLIRRFAGRYAGGEAAAASDAQYLSDMREMYSSAGYPSAYLATVRSLATPRTLLGWSGMAGRLRRTGIPLLLIWGARDPLFPLEHARRTHAAVPGSGLAVIEGAGHTPQAERPDEFNRALLAFLTAD